MISCYLHNGGYVMWFNTDPAAKRHSGQFIDYYAVMFPYRRKKTDPQGDGNWMVLE